MQRLGVRIGWIIFTSFNAQRLIKLKFQQMGKEITVGKKRWFLNIEDYYK